MPVFIDPNKLGVDGDLAAAVAPETAAILQIDFPIDGIKGETEEPSATRSTLESEDLVSDPALGGGGPHVKVFGAGGERATTGGDYALITDFHLDHEALEAASTTRSTGGETIHIESFSWGVSQLGGNAQPAGTADVEATASKPMESLAINFTKIEYTTTPMPVRDAAAQYNPDGDYITDFQHVLTQASAAGNVTAQGNDATAIVHAKTVLAWARVDGVSPLSGGTTRYDGDGGSGEDVVDEPAAAQSQSKELYIISGSYGLGATASTDVFAFDGFKGGVSVVVGNVEPAHTGGINVLMGDGSVRFVRDGIDDVAMPSLEAMEAFDVLATAHGAELIPTDQFALNFTRVDFDL